MLSIKRTRSDGQLSPTPSWRSEETLTDAGIYLLALGGFYVSYQVIYAACLSAGFPADQASVVAALADFAILAYSFKAKQAVERGESAWGLRLATMLMSFATFYTQIHDVWNIPFKLVLHSLAPTVWVAGHEFMLRPKLRRARKRIHDERVAAGLRPAPVGRLRWTQWFLAPFRTFPVWRMMQLSSVPMDQLTATRQVAERWQDNHPGDQVPTAWVWSLQQAAPSISDTLQAIAVPTFKDQPALPPAPKAIEAAPSRPTSLNDFGWKTAPEDLKDQVRDELPPPPPPGRSKESAAAYRDMVIAACSKHGIRYANIITAELMGVSKQYVGTLPEMAAS